MKKSEKWILLKLALLCLVFVWSADTAFADGGGRSRYSTCTH